MDLATGEVSRAEALLRWHDPEHGLVMPSGLPARWRRNRASGHEIGAWVLEQRVPPGARVARRRAGRHRGREREPLARAAARLDDAPGPEAHPRRAPAASRRGCELEVTETSMVRDLEGVGADTREAARAGRARGDRRLRHRLLEPLAPAPPAGRRAQDRQVLRGRHRGRPHRQAPRPAPAVRRSSPPSSASPAASASKSSPRASRRNPQLAFLRREGCAAGQGYLLCPPLPAARAREVAQGPQEANEGVEQ